jgi:hypothetical protein
MLCSSLHCQKSFKLKHISYKIAGLDSCRCGYRGCTGADESLCGPATPVNASFGFRVLVSGPGFGFRFRVQLSGLGLGFEFWAPVSGTGSGFGCGFLVRVSGFWLRFWVWVWVSDGHALEHSPRFLPVWVARVHVASLYALSAR